MGHYVSPNGTLTPFSYVSLEEPSFLKGVDAEPPVGAATILFPTGLGAGMPLPMQLTTHGAMMTTRDSDGDGLADWEELTAAWGYLSGPDSLRYRW